MKQLLNKNTFVITLALAMIFMAGAFAYAGYAGSGGDTVQVTVKGTYGQTEARSMLTRVNNFRSNEGVVSGDQAWWLDPAGSGSRIAVNGLDPLTYDYKLERYAMKRAAELAVQYSHTRPDGTSCLDATEVTVNGENIAYGTGLTEAEVFNLWLEADEKTFEDQGHRVNMLGGYYDNGTQVYTDFLNTIGIGHFVYEGVDFWVQEFGQNPTGAAATDPSDSQEEVNIDVLQNLTSDYTMTAGDVSVGYHDTLNLDDADIQTTCQIMNGNLGSHTYPVASEYSWENMTPEYLSLEDKSLRGEKTGTGKLAVTNSYNKVLNVNVTVTPRDIADAQVSGARTSFLVGETIYFARGVNPIIVVDGEELEFGTDYCFDMWNGERWTLQDFGRTPSTAAWPIYKSSTLEYVFKGMGNYTGTAENKLYVEVIPNTEFAISTSHDTDFSLVYGGESETIDMEHNYSISGDYEINVADESVISVEQVEYRDKVIVTPKGAGETTFTLRLPGEEGAWNTSNTLTFTVTVEKGDIANAEIQGIKEMYEYTGSAIKPKPQVYMGEDLLVEGQDYELAYLIDGEQTEEPIGSPGKKTVVTLMITGIGDSCYGTTTASFTINPVTLDVALDSSYAYRKSGVKPQPVVSRGGKTLTLGEDYELTYGENNEVGEGKGTVTVTGIGDYSIAGTATYYFDIVTCDIADAQVSGEKTTFLVGETIYFNKGVKPIVIVDGEELDFGVDYCFSVWNGERWMLENFGRTPSTAAWPIYKSSTLEYVFKGMGNYEGTAENRLYVEVVPNTEFAISTDHDTDFSLVYGGETETINIDHNYSLYGDYEIDVADESVISVERVANREQVIVTPKGAGATTFTLRLPGEEGAWNTSNTLTFTVTVEKADFAGHVTASLVNPDQEYYYSPGNERKPAVNVYYDKTTKLEEGKDYTVTYEDNMYAGTARIIVSPADSANFEGGVVVTFEIKPLEAELVMSSSAELVFGEEKIITFSGAASKKKPLITVDGDSVRAELVEFNDKGNGKIKLTGSGVGNAVVRFLQEGDNRYTGVSGTINVTVSEAEISDDEIQVSLPEGPFVYTGQAVEPEVRVSARGIELTDEFCAVSYANNIDPGKGKITVVGKSGLVFTKDVTFEITLADLSDLRSDVEVAKELLDSVNVSENGDSLLESESWVDQQAHDALAAAIQSAESFLTQDKYTEADVKAAEIAVNEAMESFRGAVKKGTKVLTKITSKNVVLSVTKYIYSGKAKKPAIKVTVDSVALTKGSDFIVVYKNNVNVGKASVVISGQGDYTGTVTKTFTIVPKGTTISGLTARSKAVTVKWKKKSVQTTGYEILLATNSKFTAGKKTVRITKVGTTSKKIAKLKAKKRYYVKIRTYKTVNGVKYYSAWSAKKSVKTKK